MKKLIFILTLLAFGFVSNVQAQGTATIKTGYPVTGVYSASSTKTVDSVSNGTDTSYFFFNAANLKNGSFVFRSTRVSGTCVITGFLEVSNDGTTWTTRPVSLQNSGDTINMKPAANATKSGAFVITQNNFAYYRFRFIGHDTGVARVTGMVCTRRD